MGFNQLKTNKSQGDLAKQSGVPREMIGKYERGEAVPSIEAAKKIAEGLEVSLDYLVGASSQTAFDKRTLDRIQELEQLRGEQEKDALRPYRHLHQGCKSP